MCRSGEGSLRLDEPSFQPSAWAVVSALRPGVAKQFERAQDEEYGACRNFTLGVPKPASLNPWQRR